MRVAVVVERFEAGGGGVEAAALRLVEQLGRRGHAVTVVCRTAGEARPAGVALRPEPIAQIGS